MHHVEVKSGGRIFDVSPFLNKHPGGSKILLDNNGKDIGALMRGKPHRHSKMAYSLLEECLVEKHLTCDGDNLDEAGVAKEKEEIEGLVDWNRGMLLQVGALGDKYQRWLDLPVDRHPLIFDSPLLEKFSVTSWRTVLGFWIPVIIALIVVGIRSLGQFTVAVYISIYVCGLFLWTFAEYLLHRFLFHLSFGKSKILITLHFLMHGMHHKVPFNKDRLLAPPTFIALIASPIYLVLFVCTSFGMANLLFAGLITGYLTYEFMHSYFHYGIPQCFPFLKQMKRKHIHHHFVEQTQGFGVTSAIWDYVFGTI